jgi:hypothetical protein
MKKTTLILLGVLMALLVSVGAFAQPVPDDEPFTSPGGSSGGNDGSGCRTCSIAGNEASCELLFTGDSSWCSDHMEFCQEVRGYSACTSHSVPPGYSGPPYCTMSGTCSAYESCGGYRCGGNVSLKNPVVGRDAEDSIAGIESFLRQSAVISDADLNDFIAATDYLLRGEPYAAATQKRLLIYRAKFNQLVALGDPRRELKPGDIPVMPHKPTKAPAAAIAAR